MFAARAISAVSGAASRAASALAPALTERAVSAALQAFLGGRWQEGEPRSAPARDDGLDQPWLFLAVSAISEAMAGTPWVLTTMDDEIVESGDIFDLLRRPNEMQGWQEFIEQVAINLLTMGRAAIIKDVPDITAGGIPLAGGPAPLPTRLIVADPARLTPVWARRGSRLTPALEGYEYQTPIEEGLGNPGGGEILRLAAWQVITIRRPERLRWSPLAGLSQQQTLESTVDLGREANKYVVDYFRNWCNPTAEFTTDQRLTADQTRQVARDYWNNHRRGGKMQVGVLPYGLKRSPSPVLQDLGLESIRRGVRETQMGVYGAPPLAAGIVENANRSNSDAQMAMLLTGPVMGVAARIASALNTHLVAAHAWTAGVRSAAEAQGQRIKQSRSAFARRATGKRDIAAEVRRRRTLLAGLERSGMLGTAMGMRAALAAQAPASPLYFDFDFDSHAVLGRLRLDMLPALLPVVDKGAALNEVLDLLDIAMERNPAGDVARVSIAVAPASAVDSVQDVPAEIPAPGPSENPPAPEPTHGGGDAEQNEQTMAALRGMALRAIRDRVTRAWLPIASELSRRDAARIRRQGAGVVARARETLADAWPANTRDIGGAVSRVLFDLAEAQGQVTALARPFADAARNLGATQAGVEAGLAPAEVKELVGVLVDDPNLKTAVAGMQAEFRIVERARWDALNQTIRDAFSRGKTFDALITDIEAFYDGSRGSAKRTAVTEVAGVLGEARHAGFAAAGVAAKSWLTTSGSPRPTHAQAEAEYGEGGEPGPIPITQDFLVGGAAMRFPADPRGPVRERVNCYCVLVAAETPGSGERGARHEDRMLARYAAIDIPTADEVCPQIFLEDDAS